MSRRAIMVNAYDPEKARKLDDDTRSLLARRSRALAPMYRLFYDTPLYLGASRGVWLYDQHGQAYLDAYNNVPVVGHCHPRVVAAVSQQMARLNTHTRYLYDVIVDYAEMLLATLPDHLEQIVFNCSGSESNDLALRMSRHITGGQGIIVTDNAYHGVTATVAEISPSLGKRSPLGTAVRTVPHPSAAPAESAAAVGARFASHVQDAADDLLRHGVRPAALIVDTIFSSDGVRPEPTGFLRPAVDVARAHGALFIADEVQAGFARLGSHMWGFQRHGIAPDIVVMGKPMGNGLPISAVVSSRAHFQRFAETARYFNTFAGNPVCCAAARAVLGIIEDEGLMDNALRVGNHLLAQLRALADTHATLAEVRGQGLFIGIDVVDSRSGKPSADRAASIVNQMRQHRILISASGKAGDVLKIRPPLIFSKEHADRLVHVLDRVLRNVDR